MTKKMEKISYRFGKIYGRLINFEDKMLKLKAEEPTKISYLFKGAGIVAATIYGAIKKPFKKESKPSQPIEKPIEKPQPVELIKPADRPQVKKKVVNKTTKRKF